MTPNLETLNLEGCNDFVELHMLVECPKLNYLSLNGSKVSNVNLGMTPRIETLNLQGCDDFVELHMPTECPNLKFLWLNVSNMSNIDFGLAPHIEMLYLEGRNDFVELHIIEALKHLHHLQSLTLSFKKIKHLPDSICLLKHLKFLELKSCWCLEQLPKDLDRLDCLETLDLTDCIFLQDIPNNICKIKGLTRLCLSYCILVENLPEELGRSECLRTLNIEGAGISRLPQSIYQLKGLRIVGSRWRLESYGFTSLEKVSGWLLASYGFTSLEEVSGSTGYSVVLP
ncbi:putative leucine-rich repeat domain superfamily [Helianthus annuus]|uniref:Leucine-rich repeat domain superfamily n=1 Tax=Helianthus annuus TaxID=4232 RepID=A0A251TQY3_HELAN|nr:putative leucine-rich repeat domain superfamily [Helianthus annuus]KAJ0524451.1 putative leucine-rich repeat domain superfamily [Helianthus annuus]KAJ0540650.1 putative leucine-rich repeat domain superfamily [Helianthus annuus]KAJ0705800.1 putative leucine-rich repeat domain superfamily [Helianthus annuus]KAJ0709937.1 putative leucine-rich repeat domain superfamily [Helianthus annuus]